MRRRIFAVVLLVLLVVFSSNAIVLGQGTSTVPAVCYQLFAGADSITGTWVTACAGATIYASPQLPPELVGAPPAEQKAWLLDHEFGSGIVAADGSFTIVLDRPLVANERVVMWSTCGAGEDPFSLVCDANVLESIEPPVGIPEAGTLVMLGTGLAGLAGYAGLRWRARK